MIHTIEFTIGEVLTNRGARIFGQVGSEPPIIKDYRIETWGNFIPPAPGVAETDWWDDGLTDYLRVLSQRHPNEITAKALAILKEDVRVKSQVRWPDILTFQGVRRRGGIIQDMKRHEFYEIKPDNQKGEDDGDEKIADLYKLYRKYGLPYKAGETYLRDGGPKKIPIRYNAAFRHFIRVLCRQLGFKSVQLSLIVRRPRPALLLYKVRVEIETEEKKRFSGKRGLELARYVFATYVVIHCPTLFDDIVLPLGDATLDGEKIPQVVCTFDVVDEIKTMTRSLSEVINSRAMGLPGQHFVVCCDEQYYRDHVVALQSMPFLASPASAWERYAAERPSFYVSGALSVMIGQSLEVMDFSAEVLSEIMSQIRAHPEIASLVVIVAAVVVTAGVAIYLAPIAAAAGAQVVSVAGAGMSLLAGDVILAETTPGILSAFGQMAMDEAIVTRAATAEIAQATAARGAATVGEVLSQLGASGGNVVQLTRAFAQKEAVTKVATVIGLAAGGILALSSRTAYAVGRLEAPIAIELSSLFLIPEAAVGSKQKLPVKHGPFDLNNFTVTTEGLFSGKRKPNMVRCLGRLTLS